MKKMKMKKLQISDKKSISQDGLYYSLTDLFRLTDLSGIRLEPWGWAQSENRSRDISRRGWFFKKCWAKEQTLIEYANYLKPGLYLDVIRAVDRDSVDRLISLFGEKRAARLDYRVARLIIEREEDREQRIRLLNERARVVKVERARQSAPTRSMQHSRSMRPSVQHRSEPDYLTQAVVYSMTDDYQSSSVHHSDDTCSSGSGDSGSSGCGD